MKVWIIGLGYVGITTAACLAKLGHHITGVEKNPSKVEALKAGKNSIVEPGIDELLSNHADRIDYKTTINDDITSADIILVAVGTPTNEDGTTDLSFVSQVFDELGQYDVNCPVLLRSTSPIGTARKLSKKHASLEITFHPEFLREGTAVDDFFNPPKIVFGVNEKTFHEKYKASLLNLYHDISAEVFFVNWETSESIKYADNIFHALKVSFANEIGRSVSTKGADPNEVMRIFCSDRQLNISPYYLKPGFAYGGSCLEKDLSSFRTQFNDIKLPIFEAISQSNEETIDTLFKKIIDKSDIFVIDGLTFKEDIDDLRRSPFVTLALRLLRKGKYVYAYDRNIEEVFGESKAIKDELLSYESFFLNEKDIIEDIRADALFVKIQKKSHIINFDANNIKTISLFPNQNISEIY